MNTEYTRVIPRDLFNEAKLLKCVGKLCLLIHDYMVPVKMSVEETGEPFLIGLLDDGFLSISNLNITIKDNVYLFKTKYNSKSNYPLYLEHDYVDYLVFDENGEFDKEFIDFINTL